MWGNDDANRDESLDRLMAGNARRMAGKYPSPLDLMNSLPGSNPYEAMMGDDGIGKSLSKKSKKGKKKGAWVRKRK